MDAYSFGNNFTPQHCFLFQISYPFLFVCFYLLQQWYTSSMKLVCIWLADRLDLHLHMYQLKTLIKIVKVNKVQNVQKNLEMSIFHNSEHFPFSETGTFFLPHSKSPYFTV